ncbi:hypothetical protein D4Q80_03960 [bacterium]|nr:MAG: hypothetical protein D4Q80_03960 [bacterium]
MVKMRSVRTISRKGFNRDKKGWFLAGFVEGEGSFNVSLRKKSDYRLGWQVVLSFNVSQKDKEVLDLLKKELDCGIIKVRKFDGLHSLDITNPSEIIYKVIPYFQKFSLFSSNKRKNFKLFCQIANLMGKGSHRTIDGLKKILTLREELNEGKGRKRKYEYNDVFPVKKSSETIR